MTINELIIMLDCPGKYIKRRGDPYVKPEWNATSLKPVTVVIRDSFTSFEKGLKFAQTHLEMSFD